MVAVGHLIGYVTGTVDLVKMFGMTLEDTRFKQLCAHRRHCFVDRCGHHLLQRGRQDSRFQTVGRPSITCLPSLLQFFVSSSMMMAWCLLQRDAMVQEVVHRKSFCKSTRRHGTYPGEMQAICWIQFWSWIGAIGNFISPSLPTGTRKARG